MICTKCARVIHKKKGDYCITAKGPHHYECPTETLRLIETQDLTRQMALEADKRVICSRVNNCDSETALAMLLFELANIKPAAILGKEGGKKSKRFLTPEQSKAMVEAREKKKREKG